MKSAFKTSAKALTDAGYTAAPFGTISARDILCKGQTIVFGDENVILVHEAGGSYSDNGGAHYVSAELRLFARNRDINGPVVRAIDIVKKLHPDLAKRLSGGVPRTVAEEVEVLSIAQEFANQVALQMPLARHIVASEAEKKERQRLAARVTEERRRVLPDLEREVLKLLEDGLLDNSNAFAYLRRLALDLQEKDRQLVKLNGMAAPPPTIEPLPMKVYGNADHSN